MKKSFGKLFGSFIKGSFMVSPLTPEILFQDINPQKIKTYL